MSNTPHTRSRTNLFLSYRDSSARTTSPGSYASPNSYSRYGNDPEESRGLMGGMEDDLEMGSGGFSNGGGTASTSALPPKWVDIADKVDEIVVKVKPKMALLDRLHAKHVLPGFKDRSAEEREIHTLATDITRDFRLTQKYIRQIAEMSKALLDSRTGGEAKRLDLIMAANVQTALATKVQELSGLFRKKQTEYLRQLKGHEGRGQEHLSASLYKDPLASLADDEQYSQSTLQSQSQSLQVSPDLAQRDTEISSIAQSITDLADLFKDLSSLVIDQGTLLDRVDYNVEQMGVDVKAAVEELKVATTYQRRSGKCQLIFLLLLLISAAFILLIYRPKRSGRDPVSSPILDDIGEGTFGGGTGIGGMMEAVARRNEATNALPIKRSSVDIFVGGVRFPHAGESGERELVGGDSSSIRRSWPFRERDRERL